MTGKQKLFAGGIASIGLASVIGLSTVSAATTTSGDTLASKIASAFNLKTADVQKVIDQDRADHQAAREADYKAKLDKAVAAGTITSAQETLIINKQKELQAAREANKDATTDEATRRANMKAEMDSLKQWASDNKIPMDLLRPMGGHRGHGPDGDGPMPDGTTTSPSASPSSSN